jgi:hypothetical protein
MKVDAIPLNLTYKINYPDKLLEELKKGESSLQGAIIVEQFTFPLKKIVTIVIRAKWNG